MESGTNFETKFSRPSDQLWAAAFHPPSALRTDALLLCMHLLRLLREPEGGRRKAASLFRTTSRRVG